MITGRNKPTLAPTGVPTIQYFNGHGGIQWHGGDEEGWKLGLAGYAIEAGGHDEDLDICLHAAGVQAVHVNHTHGRKEPEVKRYWFLGRDIAFHPLTAGPRWMNVMALIKDPEETAKSGIGATWNAQRNRSTLALRGYDLHLLQAGYDRPVQITVSGLMTNHLLSALISHVENCERADEMARQRDPQAQVEPWEMAMRLGVSHGVVQFGKQSSASVFPIVHLDPKASVEVMRSLYMRNGENGPRSRVLARIADDWESTQAWALGFNIRAEGEELPPG